MNRRDADSSIDHHTAAQVQGVSEREIRANERGLVVDAFKTFGAECAVVAKVEAFFGDAEREESEGVKRPPTWPEGSVLNDMHGKADVWVIAGILRNLLGRVEVLEAARGR